MIIFFIWVMIGVLFLVPLMDYLPEKKEDLTLGHILAIIISLLPFLMVIIIIHGVDFLKYIFRFLDNIKPFKKSDKNND